MKQITRVRKRQKLTTLTWLYRTKTIEFFIQKIIFFLQKESNFKIICVV